MYFECLSEIEDEIDTMQGIKKLKDHKIEYEYINYEKRILHNDN